MIVKMGLIPNRKSFKELINAVIKEKVVILKDPNGDSRYCENGVTFDQFSTANDRHRSDVRNIMMNLAMLVKDAGCRHDITKKETEQDFYRVFTDKAIAGEKFKTSDWYKYHSGTERHHLLSNCPDDVSLIDVMEYISDCVAAGTARAGKVSKIELDNAILQKAFRNTVDAVIDMVELKE